VFKKFKKIMSISLQENMEYKFNFITSLICSFIPLAVNSLIWFSISDYSAEAYGYSLNEMITYYFVMMIITNIVYCDIAWRMSNEIRYGGLTQYLLKPCRYINYVFYFDLPKRLVFVIFGTIPILMLYLFIHRFLVLDINLFVFTCFLVSLCIGYIINFLLYYMLGLFSFFLSEVGGIIMGYTILVNVLAGKVFPLSLLPGVVGEIVAFTPFQYTGFVSASIIQSKYQTTDILLTLGGGIIWIAILWFCCEYLWRLGNKKYAAFGG